MLGPKVISSPSEAFKPLNPVYWFISGATAGGAITVIAC